MFFMKFDLLPEVLTGLEAKEHTGVGCSAGSTNRDNFGVVGRFRHPIRICHEKLPLTCRFCEVAAKHAAKRALPPRRTIATD